MRMANENGKCERQAIGKGEVLVGKRFVKRFVKRFAKRFVKKFVKNLGDL